MMQMDRNRAKDSYRKEQQQLPPVGPGPQPAGMANVGAYSTDLAADLKEKRDQALQNCYSKQRQQELITKRNYEMLQQIEQEYKDTDAVEGGRGQVIGNRGAHHVTWSDQYAGGQQRSRQQHPAYTQVPIEAMREELQRQQQLKENTFYRNAQGRQTQTDAFKNQGGNKKMPHIGEAVQFQQQGPSRSVMPGRARNARLHNMTHTGNFMKQQNMMKKGLNSRGAMRGAERSVLSNSSKGSLLEQLGSALNQGPKTNNSKNTGQPNGLSQMKVKRAAKSLNRFNNLMNAQDQMINLRKPNVSERMNASISQKSANLNSSLLVRDGSTNYDFYRAHADENAISAINRFDSNGMNRQKQIQKGINIIGNVYGGKSDKVAKIRQNHMKHQQVNGSNEMEFQNIKIVQNLSPTPAGTGGVEGASRYTHGYQTTQKQQKGLRISLVEANEQGNSQMFDPYQKMCPARGAEHIGVKNIDKDKSHEQLNNKFFHSRLGNNTLNQYMMGNPNTQSSFFENPDKISGSMKNKYIKSTHSNLQPRQVPPASTSSGSRQRETDQDAVEIIQPRKVKYTKPLTNNISTADKIQVTESSLQASGTNITDHQRMQQENMFQDPGPSHVSMIVSKQNFHSSISNSKKSKPSNKIRQNPVSYAKDLVRIQLDLANKLQKQWQNDQNQNQNSQETDVQNVEPDAKRVSTAPRDLSSSRRRQMSSQRRKNETELALRRDKNPSGLLFTQSEASSKMDAMPMAHNYAIPKKSQINIKKTAKQAEIARNSYEDQSAMPRQVYNQGTESSTGNSAGGGVEQRRGSHSQRAATSDDKMYSYRQQKKLKDSSIHSSGKLLRPQTKEGNKMRAREMKIAAAAHTYSDQWKSSLQMKKMLRKNKHHSLDPRSKKSSAERRSPERSRQPKPNNHVVNMSATNIELHRRSKGRMIDTPVTEKREENNTLSEFVEKENKDCDAFQQHLNRIDERNSARGAVGSIKTGHTASDDENVSGPGPAKLKNIDTRKLQREMASMNQLCEKLVSSKDNQEPLLEPLVPQKMQVYGYSCPTIVRCFVDKIKSPIKIKIDYSMQEGARNFDLTICHSSGSKNPNPASCETKIQNKPRSILIYAKDLAGKRLDQFNENYVYISFLSESGCTLGITYLPERGYNSRAKYGHKRQVTGDEEANPGKPASPVPTIPKDDPYYLEMLEQNKENQRKQREAQSNTAKHKSYIFNHPMLSKYHNKKALQKANQIEENNQKYKFFLLHKWDYLKQIKAAMVLDKQKEAFLRYSMMLMILHIKMGPYLRKISRSYERKKTDVEWKARAKFVSSVVHRHLSRHLRRRGKDPWRRARRTINLAMILHYNLLHDRGVRERAKARLHEFMLQREMQDEFLFRVRNTMFQIEFIQRKFRNVRELMRQRTFALRHCLLARQTFLIMNSLRKAGTEQGSALATAMAQLSESKKDFITDCFIHLAKFDFRKQFLLWFQECKLDPDTVEGEEKIKEVEEGIAQTEQMIASLTDFINEGQRAALTGTDPKKGKAKPLKKAGAGKKPKGGLKIEAPQDVVDEAVRKADQADEAEWDAHIKRRVSVKRRAKQAEAEEQNEEKQRMEKFRSSVLAKLQSLKVLESILTKRQMPKFAIYSRLDKDLLKNMLIRATQLEDADLSGYRQKFFNPEKKEDGGSSDSMSDQD